MDNTYKTNRYKLPLLHIVGISPWHTTFTSAYCFMSTEGSSDYTWALEALKNALRIDLERLKVIVTDNEDGLENAINDVFPNAKHQLCTWHIEKKTLTKLSEKFAGGTESESVQEIIKEWTALINCTDVESSDRAWATMQEKWNNTSAGMEAIKYICNEYMVRKEKFLKAYTNRNLHFGNNASSRVEGAHAALKKYLGGSNADLYLVFEAMEAHLKDQHIAASKKLSDERQKIPNLLQIPLFQDVVKKVSSYALKKVHEQYLRFLRSYQFQQDLPACTKYHNHALGMPCAHDFSSRLPQVEQRAVVPTAREKIPELPGLKITDFNPHWWLQVSTVHPITAVHRESDSDAENTRTFTQQQEDVPSELSSNRATLDQALGSIRSQFGHLPAHQKVAVLNQVMRIASSDPSASQTVLEPNIKKRGRGRPPGSKNKKARKDENSCRRDPSAFEHAIARSTGNIVSSRRCTKCKMPGHNKRSCSSVPSKENRYAVHTESEVDEDSH